jgi:cytoskeletal protein CcmA (bactofilin family)
MGKEARIHRKGERIRSAAMATSANNEFSTTIGPDAIIKGQLHFEKGLQLLGKVEGEIESAGQLVIGDGATLTGDAKAGTIRLDGKVKGNLTAESRVQLSASARLEGDLCTARLEVAEGAVLVGRCSIGVEGNGQAKETAASKPAAAPVPVGAGAGASSDQDKNKPTDSRRR